LLDGNDRLYLDTPIDRVPLAVREPHPFRIEVETPAVPLVRGSSLDLPVRVLRDEGF
jgi:hypothetical protein